MEDILKDLFKNTDRNNALRSQILRAFISGMMTDDERAALYGLPKTCRMRENSKVISPENLIIGEHCWIGEGALLDASGGLEIGSHTSIGLNVYVFTHSNVIPNLLFDVKPQSPYNARAKTKIGNGCMIAGPSVIQHGVTIGDRTMVLPFSTVTKDTPGNCIVAGSPAKVIKTIDDAYIRELFKKYQDLGQIAADVKLPDEFPTGPAQ